MRFYLELIYCAESAQLLGEAQQDTASAIQQIEEVQKLESMLTPVPVETMKMLDTMLSRFRMLKIKYDFWLQPLSLTQRGAKKHPSMSKPCWEKLLIRRRRKIRKQRHLQRLLRGPRELCLASSRSFTSSTASVGTLVRQPKPLKKCLRPV
jgi:hypothetical protein